MGDAHRASSSSAWLLVERLPAGLVVTRAGSATRDVLGRGADEILADGSVLLRAIDADDRPATLDELLARASSPGGHLVRTAGGATVRFAAGEFPGGPCPAWGLVATVERATPDDAQRALADRLAPLGTLASGLAHEMNNPLSYVLANLQLVIEQWTEIGPAGEEGARWLEALRDASEGAERVREIVRDMQAFHRTADQGVEPTDPLRALDAALLSVRDEIRGRARLIKSLSPVPPVMANEPRLRQVFVKLLSNAAQSIPAGDPQGQMIEVASGTAPDGRVFVEVKDSGAGIAPDVRARMFDPFFTTRQAGEGTGLGLFVCHAIIAALGGEISVQSEQGRGSSFRVILPAAPAAARPARRRATSSDVVPRSPRGRVLVVDDEPLLVRAVVRALRDSHDVEAAKNANDALARLLAGENFDVILCDVMMPDLPGPDLFERVRAARPEMAERFVFITGGAFNDGVREFLASVPNTRLEKPFVPDELRTLVAARVWASTGQAGGRGDASGH